MNLSNELANLFAQKFIARSDVKARQKPDGSWTPDYTGKYEDPTYLPWSRPDLLAHIAGDQTYGHYLVNQKGEAKLFAFDVDLNKADPKTNIAGYLPTAESSAEPWPEAGELDFEAVEDLRTAWLTRNHHARWWMKTQFREIANRLASAIHAELGLPTAVAYSGGKGIHVYGFTGLMPAQDVRDGAEIALEAAKFEVFKGKHFFRTADQSVETGFPNLSVELFPKQVDLEKDRFGNLMRLPLGRNLKSKDPTFFVDMTQPVGELRPIDPVYALTTDNQWKKPNE